MIKVFQKNFGPTDGDCYSACVASLLELEDVPNFCLEPDWYAKFQNWLIRKRMYAITIKLNGPASVYELPLGLSCIVTGQSPRHKSMSHSIVCVTAPGPSFTPVHDPHPSQAWIVGKPFSVCFLVTPAGPNKLVVLARKPTLH